MDWGGANQSDVLAESSIKTLGLATPMLVLAGAWSDAVFACVGCAASGACPRAMVLVPP